jgi:hypothetical protein
MTKKKLKSTTAEHVVLSEMRVRKGRGSRPLTQAEIQDLVQMFAAKIPAQDFDVLTLAPAVFGLGAIAWFIAVGLSLIRHALPHRQPDVDTESYHEMLRLIGGQL